jgi:cell division inhibitor SulA
MRVTAKTNGEWGLARLAAAFVVTCLVFTPAHSQAATGLMNDVVFRETSPLSASTEIMRRLLSPLAMAAAQQVLIDSRQKLSDQPVDPAQEKFVVYVPPVAPANGYGLLVFVLPWQDARLPADWSSVLDRNGVIFVSAARSGNAENVLGRRVPLALIAEQNIVRRYSVDPQHIYIGGFSGGARVAMRIAMAYPDVFRGALLNAGGDPIGKVAPQPPQDLFFRFQDSTRLVYVTGSQDPGHLSMAAVSRQSMRDWCVFDTVSQITPEAVHEVASAHALSRALDALLHPAPPDPAKVAACRTSLMEEAGTSLQKVQALIADGKNDEAEKLLIEIDQRFGGLAAPRSAEIQSQLGRLRQR